MNSQQIPNDAPIDCRATSIAFLDEDFARHHQITLQQHKEEKRVDVIDGIPIESGDITHIAKVGIKIHDHREQLPMFITKLWHYRIFLGIPWILLHDVALRFASNTVSFGSQYCMTYFHHAPVTVQGVTEEPLEPICSQETDIFQPQIRPWRPFGSNIVMLNEASFCRTACKGRLLVFKAFLYNIIIPIEDKDLKKHPLEEIIPKQYHEVLPLFSKVVADRLLPHRPGIDHDVPLNEGESPMWGPLYSMSRAELVVLKDWLEETMLKGFICQ